MNFHEAIDKHHQTGLIPEAFIASLENDQPLRLALVDHFKIHYDRPFAIALLNKMTALRKEEASTLTGDSIMLACYILGLHNTLEDCLLIWDAKTTDFDTFCYVDIQLVPFAGADETIAYLKTLDTDDARDALNYMLDCQQAGDFDDLKTYHAKDATPWFV